MVGDLFRRSHGDNFAPRPAGARAKIDHVVGGADQLEVVLDDQDGVAQVAQAAQDGDQALRIARVQPDGGLIQDVEHAGQPRPEQRRQAQALRLARREGGRGALEGQVAQANLDQAADALVQVDQDRLGDQHLLRAEVRRQALRARRPARPAAAARPRRSTRPRRSPRGFRAAGACPRQSGQVWMVEELLQLLDGSRRSWCARRSGAAGW